MVVLQHRVVVVEQGQLVPRVDQKLVGPTRVVHVMYCCCHQRRHDLQVSEDILEEVVGGGGGDGGEGGEGEGGSGGRIKRKEGEGKGRGVVEGE